MLAVLVALVVVLTATQQAHADDPWWSGARSTTGSTGGKGGASSIGATPGIFGAAFHFNNYSENGNDTNGFYGELTLGTGVPIGVGMFEFAVVAQLGSTDLANNETLAFNVMGQIGMEFIFGAGSSEISLVIAFRSGLGLVHSKNLLFTNESHYVPILGYLGTRIYPGGGPLFIQLGGNVGTFIGIEDSFGGTPKDLLSLGFNVGFGVRI
ncbi:MAG: hypothetical protein AB7K09_08875 [Planctomycetota bacterium]